MSNPPHKQQYASLSDIGNVAEVNEDTIFTGDNLWIIADGMGGHACGEVASEQAITRIQASLENNTSISDSIQQAHEEIVRLSTQDENLTGMGTTIVALIQSAHSLELAWVGDSRAYLWDGRKNTFSQLTKDHSLVEKLLEAGVITPEQSREHPKRHVITQCLGSLEVEMLEVDTLTLHWQNDQKIMLCSDGLTDELTDNEIANVLSRNITLDEQVEQLVDKAKLAGGKDNISVILIAAPTVEHQNIWNKLTSVFR